MEPSRGTGLGRSAANSAHPVKNLSPVHRRFILSRVSFPPAPPSGNLGVGTAACTRFLVMVTRRGVITPAMLVLLTAAAGAFGQPPDGGNGAKKEAKKEAKGKDAQAAPDEQRAILKEIEEAYK